MEGDGVHPTRGPRAHGFLSIGQCGALNALHLGGDGKEPDERAAEIK